MEMLFGPYGAKLIELAHHHPSTALTVALAGLPAIDWLIHPDGAPGDAGIGGLFDAGDGGDRGE
jgi:hypothetical protein